MFPVKTTQVEVEGVSFTIRRFTLAERNALNLEVQAAGGDGDRLAAHACKWASKAIVEPTVSEADLAQAADGAAVEFLYFKVLEHNTIEPPKA